SDPYAGRHAVPGAGTAGAGRATKGAGAAAAVLPTPAETGWWSDDEELRNVSRRALRGPSDRGPSDRAGIDVAAGTGSGDQEQPPPSFSPRTGEVATRRRGNPKPAP